MDTVLRAAVIYITLLVLVRLSGKRTLGELTGFDLVLLLIIGDATSQGILGDDYSLTNSILAILTLLMLDIGLALLKQRKPGVQKLLEGLPIVIVENGKCLQERMRMVHVDESDILEASRLTHGLERFEDIKYAVLERNGKISIIPRR